MPSFRPDPRSSAQAARQALEEAYLASFNSPAGSLVFTALTAVKQVQAALDLAGSPGWAEIDPDDVDYSNLAL